MAFLPLFGGAGAATSAGFAIPFPIGGFGAIGGYAASGTFQPAWAVYDEPAWIVSTMRKNVASQVVTCNLVSKTDGSAVTSGTTDVYVTGNAGTQAAGSGTVTHEGNGEWSYVPTQAETNYNHVAYTFVNSSAINRTVEREPVSFDPTDAVRIGLTALPNAAADAAGGLPISDAGGLDLDNRMPSATSTTNINTVFSTDFAANYNTTLDQWNVNTESWNATAVPAEHTAGYPIVTIKDGTGTGEINTNAGAIALVDLVTTTTTVTNKTGYSLATNVWDELLTNWTTVGTFGYLLNLQLDTNIGSRGTSTLTQTQVTGGAYALNSASFAFNAALPLTTQQKADVNAEADTAIADAALAPASTALSTAQWTNTLATNLGTLASHDPGETIMGATDAITVTTNNDKTGYKLASDGLDSVTASTPTTVATTFPAKMMQLWARFFGRTTRDSDEIKTYRSDGTTVATTQTYTASGSDEDVGAAS